MNPDISFFLYLFKSSLFLFVLILASISDFRTRTVSDSFWIVLILFLFPITFFEIFLFGFPYFFDIFLSSIIIFVFATICFYFKILGGADCKAFLLMAAFFPIRFSALYPFFDFHNLSDFLFSIFSLILSSFIVSVLMNALLLSLIFLIIYSGIFIFHTHFFSLSFLNNYQKLFQASRLAKPFLNFEFPFFIPLAGGFLAALLFENIIFRGLVFLIQFLF
jgi:Type IV leader peptidase family.